jgi:hypothetical protein
MSLYGKVENEQQQKCQKGNQPRKDGIVESAEKVHLVM